MGNEEQDELCSPSQYSPEQAVQANADIDYEEQDLHYATQPSPGGATYWSQMEDQIRREKLEDNASSFMDGPQQATSPVMRQPRAGSTRYVREGTVVLF